MVRRDRVSRGLGVGASVGPCLRSTRATHQRSQEARLYCTIAIDSYLPVHGRSLLCVFEAQASTRRSAGAVVRRCNRRLCAATELPAQRMGLDDLWTTMPPHDKPLGWELATEFMQRGAHLGSLCGLAVSPAAWLAASRRSPSVNFYTSVLPHSAAAGLGCGLLAGGLAVFGAAACSDASELWAHALAAHEVEHARRNQWASVGAGTGAIFATPGPGSALFRDSHWIPRLGGGTAVGVALGLASFVLSCQPAARPYLHYLPVGMQPTKGRLEQEWHSTASAPHPRTHTRP